MLICMWMCECVHAHLYVDVCLAITTLIYLQVFITLLAAKLVLNIIPVSHYH